MNINNEYFSRIIYQKNAIENLEVILKQAKTTKKVFFISSKTPYQMFGAFVVNQFNLANKEFVFELIDNKFDLKNAKKSAKQAKNCEFVVCLGGGGVIDFAKVVATLSGAKLITVVSSVANTAAFSKYAYLKNNTIAQQIECKLAEKILIDENFIIKCNKNLINSGVDFILSFSDLVFNLETSMLLFGQKHKINALKTILAKLHDTFLQSNNFDPLILMDMQIDLGYFLTDVGAQHKVAFFLALLLKSSCAINNASFGKLCLISAQILQACYEKYFSLKKVDTYNFLNLHAISAAVNNLNIQAQQLCFSNIKQIRVNKQLFLKINAVKNQVVFLIEKTKQKLQLTAQTKTKTFYDFNKCLCAFSVLPYVYDCCVLTNLLFSSGLIVC